MRRKLAALLAAVTLSSSAPLLAQVVTRTSGGGNHHSATPAPADAVCSVKPPLVVEIDSPVGVSGRPLQATATVLFKRRAERIRIVVTGEGALSARRLDTTVRGPWAANETYRLAVASTPSAGEGALRVEVEVLGEDDRPLYGRVGYLYTWDDGESTWTSGSSPTELRFKRIEGLQSRGRLTAETASEARKDVVTARVEADSSPRPEIPRSLLDERIDTLYRPWADSVAASTPKRQPGRTALAPVTLTVKGKAEWTDTDGGKHPIPSAVVEIGDAEGPDAYELIATTTTDAQGNYTATFSHDDGIDQGNPDILVEVFARSAVADLKPGGGGTYSLRSPTVNEVADGSTVTVNLTAGNVADGETVFSLHHAFVVIGAYIGSLTGSTPAQIPVRFPTSRSTSLFDSSSSPPELHILRLDRWDWDVAHHEYGHYVSSVHLFALSSGGSHSFGTANGHTTDGLNRAFGEGWPTFFGISGQQAMAASGLGVPDVGDAWYQDTEDATISTSVERGKGLGEDDELSTVTALWDIFDLPVDGDDQVSSSDRTMFTALKGAKAATIGGAWETLAASRSTKEKAVLGAVFAQAKIAPELTDPDDHLALEPADPPPTFTWEKNGPGLNDFKIKFYKNDFSAVLLEKALGDVDSFTPTAAELTTILSTKSPVKWVVEGRNTSAPATPGGALGFYWSGARTLRGGKIAFVIDDTGSMTEEFVVVRNALRSFVDDVIATLPAGEEPPMIQLVTFRDTVTDRLTTNDMAAMREAVDSLSAIGGGDCPEEGARALQYAAGTVGPGATILFATDASSRSGVDVRSAISSLRAQGITVNVILSGDCSTIPGAPDNPQEAQGEGDTKPGTDEPPIDPGTNPGQAPPDDHANVRELATFLAVGAAPTRGLIGLAPDDLDFFTFALSAGKTYGLSVVVEAGGAAIFAWLDTDGSTILDGASVSTSGRPRFTRTITTSGNYYLRASRATSVTPSSYLVSVVEDPFTTLTGVQLYSMFAFQTGGAFLVRDNVNAGVSTEYESAIFNILVSGLRPAVIGANPTQAPRGGTISLALTGRRTSWRPGTTVSFSGTGITVTSVGVTSATTLTATVTVDAGADLGLRNVEVRTQLGGTPEVAGGKNVIQVADAPAQPTILSVDPSTVGQGQSFGVTLRGFGTAWQASSTVSLGGGITVSGVNVRSATQIDATIVVFAGASIGFRTATVRTGGVPLSQSRAIFVTGSTATLPQLTSLTPTGAAPGQELNVDVRGLNTNFVAGVTSASFGSGVDIVSVTVIGPTQTTVRVRVQTGASTGFRDVQLTTETEVAVRLDGFFIQAAGGGTSADLAVNKTTTDQVVAVGASISYTISVTNGGPDGATGVRVTDTLPSGVTFRSASPACSFAGGTVTCNLGNLASGGRVDLSLVVRADAAAAVTNHATVTGNEPDPSTANNSATSPPTTVNPVQAEVAIPTLSEWGLILLALALAGAGVFFVRRLV